MIQACIIITRIRPCYTRANAFVRIKSFSRKEVIHRHVLVPMPCYDLTPIISPTLVRLKRPSGVGDSHGLTGGVYKTRERIHRNMLICDY